MLGGQTNCQSVQTVISDDGEDNKTSPDVLNQRPAGSSSGEQLHWNTGNSCKHNDFIVSSSDYPGALLSGSIMMIYTRILPPSILTPPLSRLPRQLGMDKGWKMTFPYSAARLMTRL